MSNRNNSARITDRKFFGFEAKSVDLEASEFTGFSAAIGNRDLGNDIIEPGAFDKTIRERVNAGRVKLLDQHNSYSTRDMWGTMVEAEEVEWEGGGDNAPTHKLFTRFSVSRAEEAAQAALRKIEEGHLDQLSIGFRPIKFGFEADDEEDGEDPRTAWLFGRGVRKIQEIQLWETSLVIWAMNPEATIVQDNVDRLVSFAQKAAASGHHVPDAQVRQTIQALQTLIKAECPASAPDAVKDNVRTAAVDVSRAVEHLEDVLSRPAHDHLTELAAQFRKEHGPSDRATFALWLSENALAEWSGEGAEAEGDDDDDAVVAEAPPRADPAEEAEDEDAASADEGDDEGPQDESAADAPSDEQEGRDELAAAVSGLTQVAGKLADALGAAQPAASDDVTEDPASAKDGADVADADADGEAGHAEDKEAAEDVPNEGDRPEHFLDEDALADELDGLELMGLELMSV